MSGVEFLDQPDEATTSEAERPSRRTRRQQLWWFAAVVLVGAAATVWAVSRPSAVAGEHSNLLTPQHLAQPRPIGTPQPSDDGSRTCHGAPFCTASFDIPGGLRAAVQRYLPTTTTLAVRSYIGRTLSTGSRYLSDRDIEASAGSVTVAITLRRETGPPSHADAVLPAGEGFGSVVVHHDTGAYFVVLQYLAPETVPPTLSGLRRLVRDVRLESL